MVIKSWLKSLKYWVPHQRANPAKVVESGIAQGVYKRRGSTIGVAHQVTRAVASAERSRLAPFNSSNKCSLRLKSLLFAVLLLVAIATLVALASATGRYDAAQAGNRGDQSHSRKSAS
jgi:cytochrome c-type biogenesis protein CcmH/NrfG